MKHIIPVIICLMLSGCASQIMEGYVGQPLQSVILDYGPPINALDMPDKTRAFQWVMDDSYTTPIQVNSYVSNNTINSTITGGQLINNRCVYTLFARWDKKTKSYYVTSFKKPSLECE